MNGLGGFLRGERARPPTSEEGALRCTSCGATFAGLLAGPAPCLDCGSYETLALGLERYRVEGGDESGYWIIDSTTGRREAYYAGAEARTLAVRSVLRLNRKEHRDG